MYVFSVKSNTKSTDSLFVYENDTIRITYHLWKNGGRMHFAIYNKLDAPLFIDWKNSSFIINDVPKQYWVDRTHTKSSGSGVSYEGVSSYNSKGTMEHDDRISFIPPHSKIIKDYGNALCKKGGTFNEDLAKDFRNYHFRNYIAYSINEDTKDERFTDSDFEVTEVKIIKSKDLDKYQNDKLFYMDR